MPDVTRYIERTSFLLRQGQPANQVALLLPTDDAWARFSPGKVSVTAEMDELVTPALMSSILSAGYNVDYIDADAIEKIGIHYPVLVIPPTDRIPVQTLLAVQRVRCWWRKGHRGGAGSVAERKWREHAGLECTLAADF